MKSYLFGLHSNNKKNSYSQKKEENHSENYLKRETDHLSVDLQEYMKNFILYFYRKNIEKLVFD